MRFFPKCQMQVPFAEDQLVLSFLGLWNCVYLIQQFVCKEHTDVCLMRHIRMNLLLLLLNGTHSCHFR